MFECGIGDVICGTQEAIWKGMADAYVASLTWMFTLTGFTTSSPGWTAAIDTAEFWIKNTAFFILLITMIIEVCIALIKQNPKKMANVAILTVFAMPIMQLTISLTGEILNGLDELPATIVKDVLGEGEDNQEALRTRLQVLTFGSNAIDSTGMEDSVKSAEVPIGISFFGIFALILAGLVVSFVDIIRQLGLMVLISLTPIVFALIATSIGRSFLRNWAVLLVSCLLVKPIMLSFIAMLISMTSELDTLWSVEALPFIFGMCLVGAIPLTVLTIFSWTGQQLDSGLASAQSSLSRGASGVVKTIVYRGRRARPLPSRSATPAALASGNGTRPRTPKAPATQQGWSFSSRPVDSHKTAGSSGATPSNPTTPHRPQGHAALARHTGTSSASVGSRSAAFVPRSGSSPRTPVATPMGAGDRSPGSAPVARAARPTPARTVSVPTRAGGAP